MRIECSVCFEELGNNEKLVSVTKCGHLFHKDCVEAWIDKSLVSTCPQCRYVLLKSDLRTVYFNNSGNRNSDIFNSSMFANMRNIHEDLCIEQTNLELRIEHLKTENETLKEFKQNAIDEKIRLQAEVQLKTDEATALGIRIDKLNAEKQALNISYSNAIVAEKCLISEMLLKTGEETGLRVRIQKLSAENERLQKVIEALQPLNYVQIKTEAVQPALRAIE